MKVIIMRGLPGAGKSTYIKKHYPNAVVCSADKYFLNEQGEYNFNPLFIGAAHRHCLRMFLYNVALKEECIIVDNTNITTIEWIPYYRIAEAMDYSCEIIEVNVDPKVCVERNIHGVPELTISKMASKWETIPHWMKKTRKVNND
jgi:predicted kinase